MSRRHSSRYNAVPPAPLPTAPAPAAAPAVSTTIQSILSALVPSRSAAPAAAPAVSTTMQSILSALVPSKSAAPSTFSIPSLPVGELMGGVSNTVRGLVLNDNWWVLLLIIFLFFPNISNRMFGGLLKD